MSSVNGNNRQSSRKSGEPIVSRTSSGVIEITKTNPNSSITNHALPNGFHKMKTESPKKSNGNGGTGDGEVEDVVMSGMEDIGISDAMDVDDEGLDVPTGAKITVGDDKMAVQGNDVLVNGNGSSSGGSTIKSEMIKQEPVMNGGGMMTPATPLPIVPKCANGKLSCTLDGSPSFPCKRCHRVFYCSDEHRQAQYVEHQPDCKTNSSLEVIYHEEEYSMWLKHAAPHFYETCLNFVLVWPSLTAQWLPEIEERENNIIRHHLLLGTMTNQEQNHLLVCAVDIPERNNENGSEHATKYEGTMYVVKRINHEAEVNRARYMPQDYNIVATKSSSPEVFIFDCRKYPEVPDDTRFSPLLRLRGHQKEGFGLSWNLKEKGKLLSGSDDKLICMWDMNKTPTVENNVRFLNASRTFRGHEDVVEDVDWHPEQRHIFASVGDDKRLILWDTRSAVSEEAVFIGKDVHTRDINVVSFSPFSEYALATGSSDATVAIWDMRNMNKKLHSLEYHQADVMQIQWSPHSAATLASTGKDNRVFVWDLLQTVKAENALQLSEDDPAPIELAFVHGGHVSNVNDISWNHHEMGMMASVTEDNILQVWKISEDLQAVYTGEVNSGAESDGSVSEALED